MEQRFSVPSAPTKTAANLANIAASGASNFNSERSEQFNTARCASSRPIKMCLHRFAILP
jgi:hypothetical protein